MTGREKIAAAVEYLKRRGVKKDLAAPFMHRALWLCAIPVAPPLFQRFLPLTLLWGGIATVTGMAVMSAVLMSLRQPGDDVVERITSLASVAIPVIFLTTAIRAAHMRWYASALGLPTWEEFEPHFDADDQTW